MTENQAIKIIKQEKQWESNARISDAFEMAIKALEKQVPKKPLYKQGTRYKWIDSVRERGRYHNVEKYANRDACPNCKEDVLRTKYCEKCGQKLDWE